MLEKNKIAVIDGAMGTSIQNLNLKPSDFGGEEYDGCNEYLNITNPQYIKSIHESFINVGANIIETNSFGGTPMVLDEYGLSSQAEEINHLSASIAKSAANQHSNILVAGSMGPTTKLLGLPQIKTSDITFDYLMENYRTQARGLISGGSDLLLVETSQDILNVKAAVEGINAAKLDLKNFDIPIAIQCTIENMGTTLAGQDVESFYLSINHLDLLWVGMNCATGPKFMREHLRTLNQISTHPIALVPNAGLPDEHGKYNEEPIEFAKVVREYVSNGWVNIIGGCCGTELAHIKELSNIANETSEIFDKNKNLKKMQSSHYVTGLETLYVDQESSPIMVGERTNVLGSRKFKKLIENDDFDLASEIGKLQINSGANILDVCLQNTERDEISDIENFLEKLTSKIKAPIMIDSTDPVVIKSSLKLCPGKIIVNSINLEDGEDKFEEIVPDAKKYGALLIVGTIDEDKDQAQAITSQRKLEIAKRSYDLLVDKYKFPSNQIIFDPLTFPVGTGDVNYLDSAKQTIEGIKLIKEKLPNAKTILGISNVSFGLPSNGREVLNSVMLNHCLNSGLDYAIVNTQSLKRFNSLSEKEILLSNNLIFDNNKETLDTFVDHFRTKPKQVVQKKNIKWDEFLKESIISGSKNEIETNLDKGLKIKKPLEIINGPLMSGMDVVSELFGKNELIVAEVLQSAEVMKTSVTYLEKFMEKSELTNKGTILLATVKGDVHDIGKNLVDIILSNNGYNVINLGIKITSQELIQAFRKYNPDFIGLSGLLVKSAQMMVETAEDLFKENIKVPILVGGAALTEKFTYLNILPSYKNNVIYATDAMSGLDIVNSINDIEKKDQLFKDVENKITHYKTNVVSSSKISKSSISNRNIEKINPVEIIPQPPDLKEHVLELPLDEVWKLINPVMLFNRHLGYKGNFLKNLNNGDNKAHSLLKSVNDVKNIISESNEFTAKVVYKFFNAQSDNDDVILYNQGNEIERFQFARQTDKDKLCLSDYLQPINSDKKDYISMFVTTFGPNIRELSEFYLNKGDFLISHVISSLALETAEASAEYIHKKIRTMWGISDNDQITNSDIFKANYTGKRFSFGYPACPLLEDQSKLWKLLNPLQTIGVNLTEEYMMDPEGSVSAIVFHHPQAKYFNVDSDGIDNLNKKIND